MTPWQAANAPSRRAHVLGHVRATLGVLGVCLALLGIAHATGTLDDAARVDEALAPVSAGGPDLAWVVLFLGLAAAFGAAVLGLRWLRRRLA
jgi:hypothetical protein